jgi:hypothetical protein
MEGLFSTGTAGKLSGIHEAEIITAVLVHCAIEAETDPDLFPFLKTLFSAPPSLPVNKPAG